MRRAPVVLLLLVLGLAGLTGTHVLADVAAQEGTPAAADDGAGHVHAAASPTSPYAADFDPEAAIRALTAEEVAQIERGEGAGFAKAAELNGVPGPRHVLDLAHELGLSHDQVTRVQAVADAMKAAVVPAGERYLAAQRRLEQDFRAGAITEEALPGRVAEVYRLEGELAAAHLIAHLQTAKLLTSEQIAAYNRLRGYQ